jgi:SET domain-containing protein
MSRKPFRVGKSPTGLGLFATEFIDKGTFIVEYKGRMLPDAVAGKLADRGAKYLYEINSRWTVDGSSRSNVARYANHSCRPNAESDVTRDKKIIIRSIKRIYPGDEITYDYGRDYFNLILKKIGCKCEKCQGIKARPPGPRPGWRATPANGHANGKAKHLNGNGVTRANGHAPRGRNGKRH